MTMLINDGLTFGFETWLPTFMAPLTSSITTFLGKEPPVQAREKFTQYAEANELAELGSHSGRSSFGVTQGDRTRRFRNTIWYF